MIGFPLGIMCCCICFFFVLPLLFSVFDSSEEEMGVCKLDFVQPDKIEAGWKIMTKAEYLQNKEKCSIEIQ